MVGLGDGVSRLALRSLSCKTGAIYTQVVDNDESGLKRAMISFLQVLRPLLKCFRIILKL